MSEFVVPYTFVPGTKAKAGEVNANFASCADLINSNINSIGTINESIVKKDGTTEFINHQNYRKVPVANATNATPIVITAFSHGRETGDRIFIEGVSGNTAANGQWIITKITNDTFSLNNSSGNGEYTEGGIIYIYPNDYSTLVSKVYVDNISGIRLGNCATSSFESLSGTFTVTSSSTYISGTGSLLTSEMVTGDVISINGSLYIVASVNSDTSITLSTAYTGTTASGLTLNRATSEKEVIIPNITSLNPGTTILVFFTNSNAALTPTLNIKSSETTSLGVYPIAHDYSSTVDANHPAFFPACSMVEFTFDGNYWRFKKAVVQNYVNGKSWYRLWNDGWVEQGGYIASIGSNIDVSITFLLPFKNTNYSISNTLTTAGLTGTGIDNKYLGYTESSKTTTGFTLPMASTAYIVGKAWNATGF